MVKKFVALMLVLVLSFSMAACGSGDSSSADKKKVTKEGGKIVVNYWHAMGGSSGEALEELVKKFNESHKDIQVNAQFQGSYEEVLNKLKQVQGTDETPAVVQLFGIGNREMIDTGDITPMYKFMEKDNFDTSVFRKNVLAFYTFNDKIYSMPFSTSNAIMFYNKDAFKEAGLDPEKPPQTYSEIEEAAKKLTVKKGSKTERYGFSFMIYGWLFEQLMANQGALIVDHDNGRTGERAEKAVFNSDEGVQIMEWLNRMYKEGINASYGRNNANVETAFKSGKVAMIIASSASTAAIVNESKFEVGTTFLPVPDGKEPQGVAVGGNSHWIMADKPQEVQDAAWEFVKFLSSPESQAFWSVNTGYFPIRKDAEEQEILQNQLKEHPQFKTASEQADRANIIPATEGAAIGVIPEMRKTVEDAMEKMYQGSVTPKQALDEAAAKVTKALERYNKTTGTGK